MKNTLAAADSDHQPYACWPDSHPTGCLAQGHVGQWRRHRASQLQKAAPESLAQPSRVTVTEMLHRFFWIIYLFFGVLRIDRSAL